MLDLNLDFLSWLSGHITSLGQWEILLTDYTTQIASFISLHIYSGSKGSLEK